jgi:hypothetical protein
LSHVSCSKVIVADIDLLKKIVGANPLMKWHDRKTYKWFGSWEKDYNADDAAYKNGFDPKDYGKCDWAISVEGCEYEIGVVKRKDGEGWTLVWDFYHNPKLTPASHQLMSDYSEAYIRQHAERNGFMVEEQIDAEGNLILTMMQP